MKPTLRDEIDTSGTHYVGKLKDVMDDIREIVREAIKYTRIVGNIEKAEDDAIDKFKNLFAQVEAKAYQEGRESVLEEVENRKQTVKWLWDKTDNTLEMVLDQFNKLDNKLKEVMSERHN